MFSGYHLWRGAASHDATRRHNEHLRPPRQFCEGLRISACHPDLPAQRFKLREQGGSSLRIEMGGDLIKKNQRRDSAHRLDEAGVRQREANQQRLLFAGRTLARAHAFGAMLHDEI